MLLSKKVIELVFSSETPKKAYLQATKWIALNIINNKNKDIRDTSVKISKIDKETTAFKVELFINLDSEEFEKNYCHMCREFQNLFYITGKLSCNECKKVAFVNQMEQKLNIKKEYRKKQLTQTY